MSYHNMRRHNAEHFGEDLYVEGCEDFEHGLVDSDISFDDEPCDRRLDLHPSFGSDSDSVCDTSPAAQSSFVPASVYSDMCRAIGDAQRSFTFDNRFTRESSSLLTKEITCSVTRDENFTVSHALYASRCRNVHFQVQHQNS